MIKMKHQNMIQRTSARSTPKQSNSQMSSSLPSLAEKEGRLAMLATSNLWLALNPNFAFNINECSWSLQSSNVSKMLDKNPKQQSKAKQQDSDSSDEECVGSTITAQCRMQLLM